MLEIILKTEKEEYRIIPDTDEDFFPKVPIRGRVLGIVPEEMRTLHYVTKYVSHFYVKRSRSLRTNFIQGRISLEDLRIEIDSLREFRQFRKEVAKAFKIEAALHFSKNRSIPLDRFIICKGWKAVITPRI